MPEKKILIVDADVASRNFIARNLVEQKYEVIQAGSGKEGLIYSWRDRPDLAVIDPTITDITGEEIARKLRLDVRTAQMPLIALSSDPSVVRIKACLDAGFNEYITKSGQAVPMLNETISRLLGVSSAAMKQGGLLMVVLSAKGGVGTSSLCANLAMNIAQNQPESRVVVVDMVLPIGSIAPIVGYTGAQNLITITDMPPGETTPEFFKQQLPEMNLWHFHLLAGSPDPESSNHLKAGRIMDIIAGLKASYDYVLVDIGRSLSRITLPLIQHADLVTLVVSTDLSAVSLTKTLWLYLKSKGVEAASIYTILNRAVGLEGLSKVDVEKILEIETNSMIPYLGNNFSFANNHSQPFSLKFPKDTAAFIFKDIAKDMSTQARKLRAE
jgi:pilus assembly protein CpaE